MLALCLHSVIIIYMKINDNNPPFDPNAEDAVHAILDVLNQMFIQPAYNAGEIDEEDEEVLFNLLGAMKIIGQKARAYEMLEDKDSLIYRN